MTLNLQHLIKLTEKRQYVDGVRYGDIIVALATITTGKKLSLWFIRIFLFVYSIYQSYCLTSQLVCAGNILTRSQLEWLRVVMAVVWVWLIPWPPWFCGLYWNLWALSGCPSFCWLLVKVINPPLVAMRCFCT